MFKPVISNKGMTLVEVIISLALIGIISIVMLTVYTSSIMLAARSGDRTINVSDASTLAESAISGSTGDELQDIIDNAFAGEADVVHDIIQIQVTLNNTVTIDAIDADRFIISKTKDTVNDAELDTDIMLYIPYPYNPAP